MKFTKKLLSVIIACALFAPYTALAENNTAEERSEFAPIFLQSEGDPVPGEEPQNNDGPEQDNEPHGDEPHGNDNPESVEIKPEELSENEIAFIETLISKLAGDKTETVTIPEEYEISVERFDLISYNLGLCIQHEHPEIFFLVENDPIRDNDNNVIGEGINITSTDTDNDGYINTVTFHFKMTKDEIEKAMEMIDAEVARIEAPITDEMSELEKILYVHDYIVNNYDYDWRVHDDDTRGSENRHLDDMVRDKTGVCQSYSFLFKYIMNDLGIDCVTVPSDQGQHMWNKVQIGGSEGKWYNIDLTYDDPELDYYNRLAETPMASYHDYFLVSDSTITAIDTDTPCHDTWNQYKWDGTSVITSDEDYEDNEHLAEDIRVITGPSIYADRKLYYTDYTSSEFKYLDFSLLETGTAYKVQKDERWNVKIDISLLTPPATDNNTENNGDNNTDENTENNGDNNTDENTPLEKEGEEESKPEQTEPKIKRGSTSLFLGHIKEYGGDIYFNTANKVYKLNTEDYDNSELVYTLPEQEEQSVNYCLCGLAYKENALQALLMTEVCTGYTYDITQGFYPTNMPYSDMIEVIHDPYPPCSAAIQQTHDGIKVIMDITKPYENEATVYIAVYDDNGALIRLVPKTVESDVTEFTPEDEAKTVKVFIWGENNEPLAYAEYDIPKVVLKAENLDDAHSDIANGTLQFFPDDTAGLSTKYEIDSDAEWYVNGVKLTNEVKGTYDTVAEYAYNKFIKGRYSTVTLKKTGGNPKYNKITIDTHTIAVVYKAFENEDGVYINMREPSRDPMTGELPEDAIGLMYVYNEKSEETSLADYTFTLDGKVIQPSELKKNDVLSIAYDETGDFEDSLFYNVTVSRSCQRGVIEEVDSYGKTVTFGEKTYKVADGALIDFEQGDDCVFYFDAYGKIAYAEFADLEMPSVGILADVREDNGVYTADLIDNTGTKNTYSVSSTNGNTYMSYFSEFKDAEGNWTADRSYAYPSLAVKYEISDDNNLTVKLLMDDRYLKLNGDDEYKANIEKISAAKLSDMTVVFDITGIDENPESYRVIPVEDLVDGTKYTGYAFDRSKIDATYRGFIITGIAEPEVPDTPETPDTPDTP